MTLSMNITSHLAVCKLTIILFKILQSISQMGFRSVYSYMNSKTPVLEISKLFSGL